MYAIAEYLSDEAKRAACDAAYVQTRTLAGNYVSRTEAGACPIGIALHRMFPNMDISASPGEGEIASVLVYPIFGDKYLSAYEAAQQFVNAWDFGRITDLAAALGIAPQPGDGDAPGEGGGR